MQHILSVETARLATTRDALERIGDYVDWSRFPSKAAALAKAGVDGPDFHRSVKANIPLSARDARALAGIAASPELHAQWAQELQQAFLWHRAAARGVPIHDQSRLALINGAATRNKRINTPKDYWLFLLFCVMQACGKEPAPVTASNASTFIEDLVDAPRRTMGEPVALTHALVLAYACVYNLPTDRNSGAALLSVVFAVVDLAAQMNDVFIQNRMIQILEEHVQPLLSCDAERAIYGCIIMTCRSTTIRHGKTFRAESAAAFASHNLTCEALQTVKAARRQFGFAADHPRLRQSLPGTCFQAVQAAQAMGLPHNGLDEFIRFKDEIESLFLPADPSYEPLGTAVNSKASANIDRPEVPAERPLHLTPSRLAHNMNRLDMLAGLLLHRPDPDRTLAGPSNKTWRFDPDQALTVTSQAIAAVDPTTAEADTAIASIYMLHAEALLCKHVRDATSRGAARRWTSNQKEEYRLARERAVVAFTQLKMAWRLRRLAGQELRAGIDAQEWGMKVLHRRSPNAAARRSAD